MGNSNSTSLNSNSTSLRAPSTMLRPEITSASVLRKLLTLSPMVPSNTLSTLRTVPRFQLSVIPQGAPTAAPARFRRWTTLAHLSRRSQGNHQLGGRRARIPPRSEIRFPQDFLDHSKQNETKEN